MRNAYIAFVCCLIVGSLGIWSAGYAADPKINLQELAAKQTPILLEFGRGWCIPCKYMKPILVDMAQAYAGRAIVMTVDMDANKDLVRDFRIRMMPTQVFLESGGKEFFRHEGTLEREQIAQIFLKMGVPQAVTPGATPQAQPAQAPPGSPAKAGGLW